MGEFRYGRSCYVRSDGKEVWVGVRWIVLQGGGGRLKAMHLGTFVAMPWLLVQQRTKSCLGVYPEPGKATGALRADCQGLFRVQNPNAGHLPPEDELLVYITSNYSTRMECCL